MSKATFGKGELAPIKNCVLSIPSFGEIVVNNLPEVGDGKNVSYNSDGIIGRASPLHTYFFSDSRTVSIQFHFFILKEGDAKKNLEAKRAIESCAYPREGTGGTSFRPPEVCTFKFGEFLATKPLCVVLQNYSVKIPTEVAFDEATLCPYKFDVDTSWMVVYDPTDLPVNTRIISSGR